MRISHSASEKFSTCGYSYFLHYYYKLRPIEIKSALVVGGAVDVGLNHLLETRNLEESIVKFKQAWDKTAKSGEIIYSKSDIEEHLLDGVEIKKESDRGYYSWLKKGEILIREYNEQVMPLIKRVIKVQIDEVLENDVGDELVIKTDFIAELHDGRIILFDNKTSSVKYDKDSVKNSEQLAVYYHALKEEYKIDACGYIVIPKKVNKQKKPAVKIEVIIDQVSEETINNTLQKFHNNIESIKLGLFNKNLNNCRNIFGDCPYIKYCHQNDMTGLKEIKNENYKTK